jgi:hypothetical protein
MTWLAKPVVVDTAGATSSYHSWTTPTYGRILGDVACTYKGRSQRCLRYAQDYVGPYTDTFQYRIQDNRGALSNWATVTFGSK